MVPVPDIKFNAVQILILNWRVHLPVHCVACLSSTPAIHMMVKNLFDLHFKEALIWYLSSNAQIHINYQSLRLYSIPLAIDPTECYG